ncbi:MAG: Cof-type HAD-IIB family hydrolase [Lactobacillus sp.]|nr:Cof-type HAD-IIB family hydrolase [Lactobacillus sp.]MCI2032302.1 Cof-type HAD-IIB family hydrolase [Lactobacillus sp.]
MTDEQFKAVALFDLDNTLLDDHKNVPDVNVAALRQLHQNGVLTAFSTGRNRYELLSLKNALQVDAMVAANGSDVFLGRQHVYQQTMPTSVLERLKREADDSEIPIGFYTGDQAALTLINDNTIAQYQHIRQRSAEVRPDFFRHAAVCMLHLYVPQTTAGDQLADDFRAAFPELSFYRNSRYSLDVVSHGMTKATGLSQLMTRPELVGLPTYAFGDGNNDLEVLQAATYGIAMGNALPSVKQAADYVTTDNLHAGIPKALRHFGLI